MRQSKPLVFPTSREATAGDSRIMVVEAEGKLVAILNDRLRGRVRIAPGVLQPPPRRSCCD